MFSDTYDAYVESSRDATRTCRVTGLTPKGTMGGEMVRAWEKIGRAVGSAGLGCDTPSVAICHHPHLP